MLRQLYVRGSLRNAGPGWEFRMKNPLATAHLTGLGLTCDGAPLDAGALTIQAAGGPARPAPAITADAPLVFAVGVDTLVQVAGPPLAPGPHTLAIRADTREIGTVTIQVSDTVAE
jgi:hypothetical protein